MEIINQYHEIAAIFIARVFLGFIFFFQGYDAVFNIKINNVIETYQNMFENRKMPKFLIVLASWYTSYTEFFCGFLLIFGLFEYVALFLLGINLIVAAIGFGLNTPIWDPKHVFPRLVLILLLLLVPQAWHAWSLDNLFFKP
jgi:putative oxidoreductase